MKLVLEKWVLSDQDSRVREDFARYEWTESQEGTVVLGIRLGGVYYLNREEAEAAGWTLYATLTLTPVTP